MTLEPSDHPHRDVSRREMLKLMGAAGIATAASGSGPRPTPPRAIDRLSCVVVPEQTEGPYFVDEVLERRDIRVDPSDGARSEGVPLTLRLGVHRVDGEACAPVTGAKVDIWQCDALGVYSDVEDTEGQFDSRGKKFLRGYQLTGREGVAEFVTVYPGFYTGRSPHIHFKIRVPEQAGRAFEFTSQLYFDDGLSDAVYERPPYASGRSGRTRNPQDEIFRREGGAQLMLPVEANGNGFLGSFDVGLRFG